jgi:hypothetical protein
MTAPPMLKSVIDRLSIMLRSRRLLTAVLVFFCFESAWIAISAAYPQAFDENFHFGLIQTYAHYWLPFLSQQPAHADAYGAVARDPSYLYHFLMSFPYRLIKLVVHGQIGQVIALRFINIGLFLIGLVLSRKVLITVGMSESLATICIFIFVLIPIVPQLAAQINYDNLLIPLVALCMLLTFRLTDQIADHRPSTVLALNLLSLCTLTSLVKYAFLPIFFGIVLFLGIYTYRSYKRSSKQLLHQVHHNWQSQRHHIQLAVLALCLLSIGMFIQRDGVNLVRYHNIEPNCSKVLSVSACKAYSPWYYNYKSHNEVLAKGSAIHFTNPVSYSIEWIYWMWYRLFFAIAGPNQNFQNFPPLPLPSAAALLLAVVGLYAVIRWRNRIFKGNIYLVVLFVISSFYVVTLLAQGYATYRYTDVLENMNGRYLLPILLFVGAIIGRGLSIQLRRASNQKVMYAVALVLLFLQGGGVFTFIQRSKDSWDVSNAQVIHINDTARHVTSPIIVNGKTMYRTHLWLFN